MSLLTGRLHGTIVGPTGRSDWSVRRSYRVNASFDRSDVWFRPTADPTVEACGHYVQPVGPTDQSDQSRCSVRRYYKQLAGHIDLIDRCGRFGYSLSDRSVRLVWQTVGSSLYIYSVLMWHRVVHSDRESNPLRCPITPTFA